VNDESRTVAEKPRILVLDDDELVLDSIRYALVDDYDVTAITSPRAALEELSSGSYQILLTDLMMAEMRGTELIREVRDRGLKLAVIMITAFGTKETAIEALQTGAVDFLEKPLSPRTLRRAVERAWKSLQVQLENQQLLMRLRQANRALLQANRDLDEAAAFAELSPSPMIRFLADGRVSRANTAAREIFHLPEDGHGNVGEVFPALKGIDLAGFIGSPQVLGSEHTLGDRSYLVVLKSLPELGVGHLYASDLTELKRAEQRLVQSQRLEAVGRLAAGVAHDFNNMLMVIGLVTRKLLEEVEGGEVRRNAELIGEASQRAADIVRQLLAFSRRSVISPEPLQLNAIVSGLQKLLGHTVGEGITLRVELDPGLGMIRQDRTQMEQVVTNLVLNARDATPEGGTITVETADRQLSAPQGDLLPGHYVALTVSDTGHGVPAVIRDRVFEPFFTTKEPGKGTGMGLATIHGIAKRAGGTVWLESEEGAGSSFTVLLPAFEQNVAVTPSDVHRAASLPRGNGEVILLVEDETDVREQLALAIECQGYRVLQARSGEEGLSRTEVYEGPIDLVLTDVIMPGISGREMAGRLRLQRGRLPVIYMSGHTEEVLGFHPEDDSELISKPFTLEQLLDRMRAQLQAVSKR
jgi:signal transduction histidine kinase